MNRRWRLYPFVLLGALLMSGCKFNLDIKIPGDGALICVKVKAKNTPDETAIRNQVSQATLAGNTVQPTFEPVSGPDADGFNIWILKVQFRGAPGQGNGEPQVVHLGIELADGADWTHLETTTADLPHPSTPQVRRQGGSGGRALSLSVENASAILPMRVDQLEVTCAPADIPLIDLNYGDPVVASLPWVVVISGPTLFQPGESLGFTAILSEPGSLESCFMRALYTDETGQLGPLGVVGQIDGLVVAIPVLSSWGLPLLLVLVATAAVFLIRIRGRPASS